MEPAINRPHLAICVLPFCFVASKTEGVKHGSPFSRFPPSFTPQIICIIPFFREDDTKAPCATPKLHPRALHTWTKWWFPTPHCCVSTALVSLEAAGRWRLSLCFQVISEVWAAQNQMLVLVPTVHREEQQNLTHCSILQVHGFR